MASLREFLRDLALDSMKQADFIKDPAASMKAAKLDDRGQRTLFSGSAAAMWDLLRGGTPNEEIKLPPATVPVADQRGSLIVVGSGIRSLGQLTPTAIAWIKASSAVFYLVADPIAEDVINFLRVYPEIIRRVFWGFKRLGLGIGSRGRRVAPVVGA